MHQELPSTRVRDDDDQENSMPPLPLAHSTSHMLLWMLEAGPEIPEDEWNEWYDTEHVPALLGVTGIHSATRYRFEEVYTDDQPPRYLAFYRGDTASVFTSDDYVAHRSSLGPGQRPAWTRRMLSSIVKARGGVYRVESEWRTSAPPAPSLLLVGHDGDESFDSDVLMQKLRNSTPVVNLATFTLDRDTPPSPSMEGRRYAPATVLFAGFESSQAVADAWTLMSQQSTGFSLGARGELLLNADAI